MVQPSSVDSSACLVAIRWANKQVFVGEWKLRFRGKTTLHILADQVKLVGREFDVRFGMRRVRRARASFASE